MIKISKVFDYYIILGLLLGCIAIGVLAGIWFDYQGLHPIMSLTIGVIVIFICVGIVFTFCSITGIGIHFIEKLKKKYAPQSPESIQLEAIPKESPPQEFFHNGQIAKETAITAENPINKKDPISPTLNFDSIDKEAKTKEVEYKETLKGFYKFLIENVIASHLASKTDAEKLFSDICKVIDAEDVEGAEFEKVRNKNLCREDIYHIGFMIKYYLKKESAFGANFIYKVFNDTFMSGDKVELNVVRQKLSSNESTEHIVKLPDSCHSDKDRIKFWAKDEQDVKHDLEYLHSIYT